MRFEMKIGVFATSGIYPISIGGPGSVAYFLAKELENIGHEITILVSLTEEQMIFLRSTEEFKKFRNVRIVNIHNFSNKIKLMRELAKYNLIHYNGPPVDRDTFVCPLIVRSHKNKQTYTLHGGLFYEMPIYAKDTLELLMANFLMKLFSINEAFMDKIIVLNRFSYQLATEAGISNKKIVVIPNGIDVEAVSKAKESKLNGRPNLLYVGRLAKVKGVQMLLRSFSKIIDEFPEAMLYIVGDGPSRRYLRQVCRFLRIEDKVSFTGFLPRITDVYRYYKSADLYILPSYIENCSISLLEALAARIPVVASDCQGNAEIIEHGINGLLFKVGNSDDLVEKITLILRDKQLGRDLAKNAFHEVSTRYSWQNVALEYHNLFTSLFNRNQT